MTSELYTPTRRDIAAFEPGVRLLNVVTIRYQLNHLRHEADARQLQLEPGEAVVVHTDRGPAIAHVIGHVSRRLVSDDAIPQVLRRATDADIKQAERNETTERDAYRFAIERIRARKLPMKLVRTQCIHDGSKLVFFFSADGRVDFRDLVKDLAHRFRTRIEMFQIGVRDGTQMLGGIGPCGRELCCSSFLTHFEPISIRMAKDQGLTLNPRKISGMCGRLMCCLVYEQKVYRRLRKRIPRSGKEVLTPEGPGKIDSVDIINQRVTVALSDDRREIFALEDLRLDSKKVVSDTVDPTPSDEKILKDRPSRSRKRRRRSSEKEPSNE
jgi:cell fate regulator YaaT (PSP1 superfamily)